jgi:hypothetical protein
MSTLRPMSTEAPMSKRTTGAMSKLDHRLAEPS